MSSLIKSAPILATTKRWANGKIVYSQAKAAIEAAEAEQKAAMEKQIAFIHSLPNRKEVNQDKREDPKAGGALGRFCFKHNLDDMLYAAGEKFIEDYNRWKVVYYGEFIEGRLSINSKGMEITREIAQKAQDNYFKAEKTLRDASKLSLPWVRHICIDKPNESIKRLPSIANKCIKKGLYALSVHYGFLSVDRRNIS